MNDTQDNKWDKLLHIKTMGRDDSQSDQYRYPYEPTPYSVLQRLANTGLIRKNNMLLDYGCGKGRVDFFLSYQTRCRCLGVEYDERIYEKVMENKKEAVSKERVSFSLANAEEFQLPEQIDRIYFFNPFSVEILRKVGRPCTELPSFIIKRLPVRLTFDNNYFNALYQGIPVGGYTKMVANMLGDVEVRLNTDYFENKEELDALAEKVIYTGPIDAYFDYKLGALEYRSVRFETEVLDQPNFQGNAAVNYTDVETPWTRIIEHKWFEFGKDEEGKDLPKTVISREYSSEWKLGDEPYYPVNDEKNGRLYEEYKKLAEKEENIIFGGRLGEYKYYDMDAVIAASLDMCEKEL